MFLSKLKVASNERHWFAPFLQTVDSLVGSSQSKFTSIYHIFIDLFQTQIVCVYPFRYLLLWNSLDFRQPTKCAVAQRNELLNIINSTSAYNFRWFDLSFFCKTFRRRLPSTTCSWTNRLSSTRTLAAVQRKVMCLLACLLRLKHNFQFTDHIDNISEVSKWNMRQFR